MTAFGSRELLPIDQAWLKPLLQSQLNYCAISVISCVQKYRSYHSLVLCRDGEKLWRHKENAKGRKGKTNNSRNHHFSAREMGMNSSYELFRTLVIRNSRKFLRMG